jgi:hypothetical protein
MKLPQLSLRELFLLVVIAAMGCGWWVEREKLESRLIDEIRIAKHWRETAAAVCITHNSMAEADPKFTAFRLLDENGDAYELPSVPTRSRWSATP